MIEFLFVFWAALAVRFSNDTIQQGEIVYLEVKTPDQGILSCEYRGEPIPVIFADSLWLSLIGTSYNTDPGRKSLKISFKGASYIEETVDTAIYVLASDFKKSVINFPASKQSALDTTNQARKEKEYREAHDAINAPSCGFYSLTSLIFPCDDVLSSTYGDERWSGGRKLWNHSGVDFAVWEDTPILAPCPGKVVMARDTFILDGTFVLLDHGAGLKTMFCHMKKRMVEEGMEVKSGDTLGFVGSTGLSTGPHLHMSVYVRGVPVNPLFWLERKEHF